MSNDTIPSRPLVHVQYLFADVVSGAVDRPTAEVAWQLVLDTWRVVEVASARASVPATPSRDEWMAALRLAIFRAEHGTPEPKRCRGCGQLGCVVALCPAEA